MFSLNMLRNFYWELTILRTTIGIHLDFKRQRFTFVKFPFTPRPSILKLRPSSLPEIFVSGLQSTFLQGSSSGVRCTDVSSNVSHKLFHEDPSISLLLLILHHSKRKNLKSSSTNATTPREKLFRQFL